MATKVTPTKAELLRRRAARSEAQERWAKENTKQFKLKLHLRNDADVIEKLASVDNMAGYVKALIRADIAKGEQ